MLIHGPRFLGSQLTPQLRYAQALSHPAPYQVVISMGSTGSFAELHFRSRGIVDSGTVEWDSGVLLLSTV
jgi:hypothetical protein